MADPRRPRRARGRGLPALAAALGRRSKRERSCGPTVCSRRGERPRGDAYRVECRPARSPARWRGAVEQGQTVKAGPDLIVLEAAGGAAGVKQAEVTVAQRRGAPLRQPARAAAPGRRRVAAPGRGEPRQRAAPARPQPAALQERLHRQVGPRRHRAQRTRSRRARSAPREGKRSNVSSPPQRLASRVAGSEQGARKPPGREARLAYATSRAPVGRHA